MNGRYQLSVNPVDHNEVTVEFVGRGCRAVYAWNQKRTRVRLVRLEVDSKALDIPKDQFIGFGPLSNARERAKTYFLDREATLLHARA